jgi:hypothetical protein
MHDQPNRPNFDRLAAAAEQWAQIADDAYMLGGDVSVIDVIGADADALRASANAARAFALSGDATPSEAEEAAHLAEQIDRLLDELHQLGVTDADR